MKIKLLVGGVLLPLSLLSSCKPTERTATDEPKENQETREEPATPDASMATKDTLALQVKPLKESSVSKEDASKPKAESSQDVVVPKQVDSPSVVKDSEASSAASNKELLQQNSTLALLQVEASQQDYNLIQPWEKGEVKKLKVMGVYLGDGKVLTMGNVAQSTTYLELSLPDGSRSIPAEVLSYDPDLNLAIIKNMQESDRSFFDTRVPLTIGDPLQTGDTAEYWGTISGTKPLHIDILASEGFSNNDHIPFLLLQSPQSMPVDQSFGFPIVKDGELRAMSSGFNKEKQSFNAINAELIQRFLDRDSKAPTGVPVIGLEFVQMDDPSLSAYLKVPKGKTGAYVSRIASPSAAADAGIKEKDVILKINDFIIDNQNMVQHPLYGRVSASVLISSLLPLGDELTFTISRQGEQIEIPVSLNRLALDKALVPKAKPNELPRYLIHGGLIFQPLTQQYLSALHQAANGDMPVEFLVIDSSSEKLRKEGYQELTALTLVIPSPVNIGYSDANFCLVEKVNGKTVRHFDEFARLLDEPSADGMTSISINKPPYTLYLDNKETALSNDEIRRNIIPQLRQMKRQ